MYTVQVFLIQADADFELGYEQAYTYYWIICYIYDKLNLKLYHSD